MTNEEKKLPATNSDVNAEDSDGKTPLIKAAKSGDSEKVKMLFDDITEVEAKENNESDNSSWQSSQDSLSIQPPFRMTFTRIQTCQHCSARYAYKVAPINYDGEDASSECCSRIRDQVLKCRTELVACPECGLYQKPDLNDRIHTNGKRFYILVIGMLVLLYPLMLSLTDSISLDIAVLIQQIGALGFGIMFIYNYVSQRNLNKTPEKNKKNTIGKTISPSTKEPSYETDKDLQRTVPEILLNVIILLLCFLFLSSSITLLPQGLFFLKILLFLGFIATTVWAFFLHINDNFSAGKLEYSDLDIQCKYPLLPMSDDESATKYEESVMVEKSSVVENSEDITDSKKDLFLSKLIEENPQIRAATLIAKAQKGKLDPSEDEKTVVSYWLWNTDDLGVTLIGLMSVVTLALVFYPESLFDPGINKDVIPLKLLFAACGIILAYLFLNIVTGKQTVEMSYKDGIVVTNSSCFGTRQKRVSPSLISACFYKEGPYTFLTIIDINNKKIRLARHFITANKDKMKEIQRILCEKFACDRD